MALDYGVTVLLGPNGAGKTTMLDTFATLRRAAGGSLRILGYDASTHAERREIRRHLGYLPQHFGYFGAFSVREFLEYAGWLKLVPRQQLPAAVDEAIAKVDLSRVAGRPLKALSGGMLRRVGIAHTIVHHPKLVILDEPAVGLDPGQRMRFRGLVRTMTAEASVLISTHLVDDIRFLADRVLVLDEGVLVFSGTPDELEAAATDGAPGDTPLERGYSSVLTRSGRGESR